VARFSANRKPASRNGRSPRRRLTIVGNGAIAPLRSSVPWATSSACSANEVLIEDKASGTQLIQ
jgi:hypothetical protein